MPYSTVWSTESWLTTKHSLRVPTFRIWMSEDPVKVISRLGHKSMISFKT